MMIIRAHNSITCSLRCVALLFILLNSSQLYFNLRFKRSLSICFYKKNEHLREQ